MGIASCSFTSSGLGCDLVMPFDSLARTFCCGDGAVVSGILLTKVAPMASPPPPAPQPAPVGVARTALRMSNPATIPTCRPSDQASAGAQRSCSKKISAFACILFQRLGHDAHIADARLFHRVHHSGESSKGNVLVGADKNKLIARIANLLPQFVSNLVDVNRVV